MLRAEVGASSAEIGYTSGADGTITASAYQGRELAALPRVMKFLLLQRQVRTRTSP